MTLPKSGKITLSEIVVNFKPSENSADHAISEYYRGSSNVSDTINNNNIPKQGRVAWSDYWGAGLQDQYDFQIPELCTNSFHSFCRGIDGWYDLQDLPKEYVGRDDTSGSIEIPIYHPQASIEIPPMEFEIGSEMGEDTQFERVYFNQITNENVFAPGNWTLEIPKKFKRLRIVATGGGAGGTVQKNLLSGDPIKNKTIKGTVESGNAGGMTKVWSTDFSVSVPGASTDDILNREVSVLGGIDTSLSYKLADSPKEFNYTDPAVNDLKGEKIFKFENIFENNNFPVNMVYRDVIGMEGNKHNAISPNGVGGRSLYSAGEIPFPEMKISTDSGQLASARSELESLTNWVSAVNAEVLFQKLNKRTSGMFFARHLSAYGSYGFLGLSAKQFVGEDSSGNEIFQTHPELISKVRNVQAEVKSLEATPTINRDGVSVGVDDNINLWAGAGESTTLPSSAGTGAGGRAGQHGSRGSNSDWTTTEGGNAAMTAYLGDFETTPGDIINIKVGAGGGREYNQYNEYFSDIDNIAKTWSVSGQGGDGSVQLFGSHGRLHSSLTHAGWILEDAAGNVIGRGYTAATSHKGNTNFQNAKTAAKYFEVLGTVNPEEPRMYYLRFSARISKNGDFSLKNRLCHIGQKHVKVIGLAKTIFENPPSLGSLFITPDTAADIEDVKGSAIDINQTEPEIINNWYIPKCNVTFTTARNGVATSETTLLETLTWSAGDATVTSSPIVYSDYTTLIITYTGVASNASVTTFEMRNPTGLITPRNYQSGEGELPMNGTQIITTSSGASSSAINLNGTEVTTAHSNTIGANNDPITFGWTVGGFAAGGSIEIRGTSLQTQSNSAGFTNTAKFTKVPSTDEGIGPDSITLGPNAGSQSFILAKSEVYVLNVSNLNGSGRPKGHNIYSYARNRTQMQLEDRSASPDAWSNADLGTTISGLCGGGWYVQSNLTYFSGSYTGSTYGKGTRRAHNKPPPPPPRPRYVAKPVRDTWSGGGDDRFVHGPITSVRVGNTYHNTYARDFIGPASGRRGHKDISGYYSDGSRGNDGGGGGGGGKIVCTAMNEAYGFGSFRNKIWLTHSAKHLTKAHQVGYHALFLPLINLGYKKDYKFVRDCLENIARHRTVDIYYQNKGSKRDLLGRIYRFALEPLCYVVGKTILFKRGKNEN